MLTQVTNKNLNSEILWSSTNKYLTFYKSFIYLFIDNKRKINGFVYDGCDF